MKNVKWIVVTVLAIIFYANAGIIITTQHQDLKIKDAQPMIQNTYLEKDMIRMDMKIDKNDMTTIFLGEKELFLMIDHKKKTYTEMTKEDLENIKKMAEELVKSLSEAFKNIPPEMQEKMKTAMTPETTKKSETVYKKVASKEKVNKWICDKYEGTLDGNKESDVWTTNWKELGLRQEDLKGFDKIGEFFTSLTKDFQWQFKVGTDEESKEMYFGFPVKTINYENDKPSDEYEIKEIKQEELKASLFEVPKGYKKEKFGEKPE